LSITADELPAWRQRLETAGIALESLVTWPGGAQSHYFRDPDDHLVEPITSGFWRIYRCGTAQPPNVAKAARFSLHACDPSRSEFGGDPCSWAIHPLG
jgi:hypothetical protein